MIKLIHGADLHLDSPFSGLTPEQAAARRQEQRELLDRLARLAREREADLLLLSGDLLDSRRTYRETAQALARSLGSLPCPVFLAPGNHDFYGPQSLYAALDWPENVHIFTSGSVRRAELPGLDCVVYGRAFLGPREDRSPLEGFRAERDGRVQLMAVHGEVDGRGEYGPISREDIACSGLDYLALGHIHQTSGLQREGDTFWAYPGCPEGRGFDELGDKGVLYVEAEPGSCRAEFVPLCRRRYQILSVDGYIPHPAHRRAGGGGPGPGGADPGAGPPVLRPDPPGPHPGAAGGVGPDGGGHPHRAVPAPDGRPVPGRAGE